MFKNTINRPTKEEKQLKKPKEKKDPIVKLATKQELINADPTKGQGDRVKPEKIFEGFTKVKSKSSRS